MTVKISILTKINITENIEKSILETIYILIDKQQEQL